MGTYPNTRVYSMSSMGEPIKFTTSITADPNNNIESKWIISDETCGVGTNFSFWNPAI